MLWLQLSVLLVAAAYGASGANILSMLPMPSRSHGILMERLMRELGNRGHHITYITAAPPRQGPIPNMTLIEIPDVMEIIRRNSPVAQGSMFNMRNMSPWGMFFFTLAGPIVVNHTLSYPAVQQLIKGDKKFDMVLGEIFLDEAALAGFAHKFQAPLVGLQPFLPNIWGNYMTGNPTPSSYIPDPQLGYSTEMTFFERVYNFIYNVAWELFHPTFYLNKQGELMHKFFGDDLPPIQDILKKSSLVLVNHHHSLAFPRPYLPNMVEVGGMHINPVKPLPADLKKYLDDSKQGVVFFSMGSNLKSSEMSTETIQHLIKGFARLPYNVLWKFEEKLENLPKNIKIEKWLPQSDLLAHPNLKLFITHGGQMSTSEAVHRGVPVLGIPIFGDQPLNMKHTENAGLGKTLQFEDVSEDTIYKMVMELTTNKKYSEAAKFRSQIFQDTILPPIETAIWWIEYVLRYKGAPHLRSQAQNLTFYQVYQLDVLAFLIAVASVPLIISLCVTRAILKKIFCKSCSNTNEKKQKSKAKKNN